MGIGRASGDDRAVVAAQQAIESPLLEVSIDGARGILFNVIGGTDMSMHEINSAAETITAAADPDANIIFGATINPDLEGEIIITVVATGFDAAYYAQQPSTGALASSSSSDDDTTTQDDQADAAHEERQLSDLDVNIDSTGPNLSGADDFTADHPVPNIWTIEPDAKANEDKTDHVDGDDHTSSEDTELEKPSFLRRLKKLRDNPDKTDKND
jgi:hypothetical protein